MDYDSIVNQRIKQKLVNREVFCCFSYEMDSILQVSEFSEDLPQLEEIENFYQYPEIVGNYYNFDNAEDKEDLEGEIQDRIDSFEEIQTYYETKEFSFCDDANLEMEKFYLKKKEKIEEILDNLEEDLESIESLETEPAEIFEWWIVSSWFANKLKQYGQCILEWGNNCYWGRQCTGQAISLDYVISRIAEDMKILKDQENEWDG